MNEQNQSASNTQAMSRCPFLAGKAFNPFDASKLEGMHTLFAQARREEPVFFSEVLQSWVVTRYEDIYSILQDTRRFSSKLDGAMRQALHPEAREIFEQGGYRRLPLLFDDAPDHTRARHIVARLFPKDAIAALEPVIRALTEELVDSFIQDREVDLVSRFAQPLPLRVILTWLGLPMDDGTNDLRRWCDDMLKILQMQPMPVEEQKECARNLLKLQHMVAELIAERRQNPRQDGLSVLAERLREGASLDEQDLASVVMLIIFAGHETTTSLLGVAVRMLLEQPGRWQQLCNEPHLIPRAVEEALRRESPVQMLYRLTTEPVEVAGVHIPAGARLCLWLPSGNWDEQRYSEPERYDLSRPGATQHLTFGKGAHVCPGSGLARLEAKVALEVLTRRLPSLRLVEAPQQIPGAVRHYTRLLLAWDAQEVRKAA